MASGASHTAGFGVRVGGPLPAFALPDMAGGVARPRDFKQRRPLLIVALHGTACATCQVWLASLAARRARLDELGIAVLVLVPDPMPVKQRMALDLDIPLPLLADEDGRVARRYGAVASDGAPGVAVCAADRYGYALAAWRAKEADALPSPDAALDRIAFAEMEDCGCGLPAWPEDAMEPRDS